MSRLPPFPARITHATLDWRDDTPLSTRFDDVYFSLAGGIDESTHVFLDNNDLPARFRAGGFRQFTIAETGFGTGLNFLVAARAFLALAPAESRLHFVSVEKFPLHAEDMARAHAHWPGLASLAAELRATLPPACPGFHRREFAGGRIRLTLLLGDADALLPRLDARVDAWFLDGFAPAKNGDLWTPALFMAMTRLSVPGATFATFTAAGAVRRGLAQAGFRVEKVDGFGRKREMLRGSLPGTRNPEAMAPRRVAVIGGGLAGCASARALAERGCRVTLFERNAALASETSGNLAGAVYPKFSAHETAQNRWYRDSYLYALARLPAVLGGPDGLRWSRCGLLQLPTTPGAQHATKDDDEARWPASVLREVSAEEATLLAGIPVPGTARWFPDAAWVHPPALCAALAAHPGIEVRLNSDVTSLQSRGDDGVQVNDGIFDDVVIANALAATRLAMTADLPLRRVRGQVTHVAMTTASHALRCIVCHEGYVTPARDGLHCVGATFAPRDPDPAVREDDHRENLTTLAAACPELHAALGGKACTITGGRTGFRAQTPDYLPVIGALVDHAALATTPDDRLGIDTLPRLPGCHVIAALGAKGIAFSLLGAEIIAARIHGEPLPVDREVAEVLDPARFLLRERRRNRSRPSTTATQPENP